MNRALLTLALSLLVLPSCTSQSGQDSFATLSNQGVLPLSSSNAFVGANLYLAREFARSTYLFNFLQGRGAPAALDVQERTFQGPIINLYYPADKELYKAELVQSEQNYQWVVRGPYPIDRGKYRDLVRMNLPFFEEPVFRYQGREHRFRVPIPLEQRRAPVTTPVPTPTPTKAQKKTKPAKVITKPEDVAGGSGVSVQPAPTPKLESWKPLTFDQQALQMAQGYAERGPTGTVIHTVKREDETLERVVQWYTGSTSTLQEVAQANGITIDTKLQTGMRIEIPLRLAKQFKRMN